MADFTTAIDWITLVGVWLFVVPDWASIKSWAAPTLNQGYYRALLDAAAGKTFGGAIIRSATFLWVLQIILNLALWLTWTFVLLQNAYPSSGGTNFSTYYIVINALVFGGTVFHVGTEAAFWQAGWIGLSFATRIIEVLIFLTAAILETILLVNLPEDTSSGWDIAFVIVLWLLFVHKLFILLPRSWTLWAAQDDIGEPETLGAENLIPSASKAGSSSSSSLEAGKNARTAAALHQAAVHAWQK